LTPEPKRTAKAAPAPEEKPAAVEKPVPREKPAPGVRRAAAKPSPAKSAGSAAQLRPTTSAAPSAPEVPAGPRPNRRKVREGVVVSNAMDKTVVVLVTERVRHSRYAKTVQRTKRLYAHDPSDDTKVGDRVRLMETRPISKTKRWRVAQVVERAR